MSGYCRVTVTGPEKWADLALPGTVPVATLMPRIIEVCAPTEEGLDPATWILTTVEGTQVQADEPLESAGVYDGDMLLLRRHSAPKRPEYVDDVRGAVEDEVDEHAWIWNPAATLSFGLTTGSLGPLIVLCLMMWLSISPVHLAVAAVGTMFSISMMMYAARRSLIAVAHVLFSASCLWGAVAALLSGWLLTSANWLIMLAFALCGALLVAMIGWSLDKVGLPYISGLGVLALSAGVLVLIGIFVDPVQGARALSVVLVLCMGVLPRAAMVMGGLSGLDYEVGRSGQVTTSRFDDTFSASDRLLLGIIVGVGASSGTTLLLLSYLSEGIADLLLCALLATLLTLRSRLFDRIRHVLPVRLAGAIGIGAVGVATIGHYPGLGVWLPIVVLVAGVILGILSSIRLNDVPRASLRRLFNWLEIVLVIVLLPVFCWSMGLFYFVGSRTGAF